MKCIFYKAQDGRRAAAMMGIVVLGVVLITIIDGWLMPPYWIKSAVKICLFGGLPLIYSLFDREIRLPSLFHLGVGTKALKEAAAWGGGIFLLILGAYWLFGLRLGLFDFSGITANMETKMGIEKEDFVLVAVYISFCNSLLEEFFFRGFGCLKLQKYVSRRVAYGFSAIFFALYHTAMMWVAFEPPLVVLSLAGLVVGGLIFNYFNEKYENLYISWLIHMGANFAINGIGCSLYGIL